MKLKHVDAMRGIAILMVILVHTAQSVDHKSRILAAICEYGQMGVQLFFVASAYTLCRSWSERRNESRKLLKFWIRRYFRIAPMYYIGVLLFLLISIADNYRRFGIVGPEEQYTTANILANVLFLHGMFPPANNNIVPGGWSIGTEMLFYAILPLLILKLSSAERMTLGSAMLVALSTVLIVQMGVWSTYFLAGRAVLSGNFLYYNIVIQLPVFVLGMLLFFLDRDGLWPFESGVANAAGFLSLTAVALALWNSNWPNIYSIIPVVSGLSFLFLFKLLQQGNFEMGSLTRIGTVSYSMYLVHFIFAHRLSIRMSDILVPRMGGDLAVAVLFAMSVLLTFLLAALSQRYLESFFINLGKNLISRLGQSNKSRLAENARATDF
jgi:peptidoglycan/LPS O-acetylase OafA/YrhL